MAGFAGPIKDSHQKPGERFLVVFGLLVEFPQKIRNSSKNN
jgi:hypothetical protein